MVALAFVSDLHFGPEARFDGKLRKLSHHAARLAADVVDQVNARGVDLFVNLGDDIEDESRAADRARYAECQAILRRANAPLVNVAGNHDTVHLGLDDLHELWGETGHLHRSFDHGDAHVVVLHTVERKDVDVRLDADQLAWLKDDLARTTRPTIVCMHHPASEQDLASSRWFARAPHLALVRERRELRAILEASGKVRAVFNGHVHRPHLDVIGGIPYVTVQSLVENLDDDAPGRPARGWASAIVSERRVIVDLHGEENATLQVDF